jgi:hypothetical protein
MSQKKRGEGDVDEMCTVLQLSIDVFQIRSVLLFTGHLFGLDDHTADRSTGTAGKSFLRP